MYCNYPRYYSVLTLFLVLAIGCGFQSERPSTTKDWAPPEDGALTAFKASFIDIWNSGSLFQGDRRMGDGIQGGFQPLPNEAIKRVYSHDDLTSFGIRCQYQHPSIEKWYPWNSMAQIIPKATVDLEITKVDMTGNKFYLDFQGKIDFPHYHSKQIPKFSIVYKESDRYFDHTNTYRPELDSELANPILERMNDFEFQYRKEPFYDDKNCENLDPIVHLPSSDFVVFPAHFDIPALIHKRVERVFEAALNETFYSTQSFLELSPYTMTYQKPKLNHREYLGACFSAGEDCGGGKAAAQFCQDRGHSAMVNYVSSKGTYPDFETINIGDGATCKGTDCVGFEQITCDAAIPEPKQIVSRRGLCLDAQRHHPNWGNIYGQFCHDGKNQLWDLIPVKNNTYLIKNVDSGNCLDAKRHGSDFGNIYEYPCMNLPNQLWEIQHTGVGARLYSTDQNLGCLQIGANPYDNATEGPDYSKCKVWSLDGTWNLL